MFRLMRDVICYGDDVRTNEAFITPPPESRTVLSLRLECLGSANNMPTFPSDSSRSLLFTKYICHYNVARLI